MLLQLLQQHASEHAQLVKNAVKHAVAAGATKEACSHSSHTNMRPSMLSNQQRMLFW
jgi:hypothetical protein